jgi:thymidylate synthase (FAD)
MKNTTNKVEYIGHYGCDNTHALSAWTSTSRELSKDKEARIPALLNMLASNGHHTPFEKSSLHFLITTDIASHIHLLKHRISSTNSESARYKELKEDKTYIPIDWSGDVLLEQWASELEKYTNTGNKLYHQCLNELTPILGRSRAKESARYFKTYNSQITADVMFNFRSFVHFLGLRNKPEAQLEIRVIAQEMLNIVKSIEGNPFEYTLKAFNL